jgi:hypothetical protein
MPPSPLGRRKSLGKIIIALGKMCRDLAVVQLDDHTYSFKNFFNAPFFFPGAGDGTQGLPCHVSILPLVMYFNNQILAQL